MISKNFDGVYMVEVVLGQRVARSLASTSVIGVGVRTVGRRCDVRSMGLLTLLSMRFSPKSLSVNFLSYSYRDIVNCRIHPVVR